MSEDEGVAVRCLREIVKEANDHKANGTEYGAGMEDGLNSAALLAEEALKLIQVSPSSDLMTRAISWMKARKLHEIDGKELIAEMETALSPPIWTEVVEIIDQFVTRILMERRCNNLGVNVAQPIMERAQAFLATQPKDNPNDR